MKSYIQSFNLDIKILSHMFQRQIYRKKPRQINKREKMFLFYDVEAR